MSRQWTLPDVFRAGGDPKVLEIERAANRPEQPVGDHGDKSDRKVKSGGGLAAK